LVDSKYEQKTVDVHPESAFLVCKPTSTGQEVGRELTRRLP
jgi:hypothetical protein